MTHPRRTKNVETHKFPRPAEPSSLAPEIKLPPKKLPQVQSTKDPRQIDDEGKSEKAARRWKFRAHSVAGQFRAPARPPLCGLVKSLDRTPTAPMRPLIRHVVEKLR